MTRRYIPTWDLESIFPGGSASSAFAEYLAAVERDLNTFARQVREWTFPANPEAKAILPPLLPLIQSSDDLRRRLRQSAAFVSCLTAQHVRDERARRLSVHIDGLWAEFSNSLHLLDRCFQHIPDDVWHELLKHPRLQPIAFPLDERRRRVKELLPPELESLANALAVDGYHAWEGLYETVVGRMTLTVSEQGKRRECSIGQASNLLLSPNRSFRAAVFSQWEEAWSQEAELCAAALNHLAGFRLQLYRQRGWSSVLKEPLEMNRMSETTLRTMWEVVEDRKDRLVAYLQRKASLLGIAALHWHDHAAPLVEESRSLAFDEAADFVIEQFHRFNPQMGRFARRAFEHRWIEAEDRPGKQPGGFCTSFPEQGESRIFLTYSPSLTNVLTLAHELGHAYHQHVVNPLPVLAQSYPMSLAETASTFAERLVMDGLLQQSDDKSRVFLLEENLRNAVAFLMNIHARFRFETAFYEERKEGTLSTDRLNTLMLEAQQHAFRGALVAYHPHFWAAKLHFFITRVPFYNFPYTFGYLFSNGLYQAALEDPQHFPRRYDDLLRDTGRMTVEELAQRHLGVDLRRPSFWERAVDQALADVEPFLNLTAEGLPA